MLYYSGFVLYDEDILKRRKAKEEPKERDICVYGRCV